MLDFAVFSLGLRREKANRERELRGAALRLEALPPLPTERAPRAFARNSAGIERQRPVASLPIVVIVQTCLL
jgi:hypothetical protein